MLFGGVVVTSRELGVSGLILNPYLLLCFVFFEGLFRILAARGSVIPE